LAVFKADNRHKYSRFTPGADQNLPICFPTLSQILKQFG